MFQIPNNNKLRYCIASLLVVNVLVGFRLHGASASRAGYYFLDVGQGDSELIILADNRGNEIKILIDGGRDKKVIRELGKILGDDHIIDVVVLTHPQLDHFGGLIDVMQQYEIGVFISTGRKGEIAAFRELEDVVRVGRINTAKLKEGDRIRYGKNQIDTLSPSPVEMKSKELNDSSLVLMVESDNVRALYTGDIGDRIEKRILAQYNVDAAILKVGHHGSRFSSTASFVDAVRPKVAVIEVGKNTYGHPTKQTLDRIVATGAKIYRTDIDGTVSVAIENGALKIKKQTRR